MIAIRPVLFIDDNPAFGELFKLFLEAHSDFPVCTFENGDDALAYLSAHPVSAVVSDYDMPDIDGISILRVVRRQYPDLPFIMLTGMGDQQTAIDALNAGADFYQTKGHRFEEQVVDLANKIRVLSERAAAQEAVLRKDRILEAISYATGHLLRGNDWESEITEILSRIGEATKAHMTFLLPLRYPDGRHNGSLWLKNPSISHPGPEELSRLIAPLFLPRSGNPENIVLSSSSCTEPLLLEFMKRQSLETLLLVPVMEESQPWGVFGCGRLPELEPFSQVEEHALRMAADLIGSLRYRLYIEEVFRNPVEESVVGVFFIRNDRFFYVNPRLCQIVGYPRERIIGADIFANIHHDDRDAVREIYRRIMDGTVPSAHLECRVFRSDRRIIVLDLYLTAIIEEEERCVVGNMMDITKRRAAEAALIESEERFRLLFSNIHDLVFLHSLPAMDRPDAIIEMNDASLRILGYQHQALYTLPTRVLFHGSSRADWDRHCRTALKTAGVTSELSMLNTGGAGVPIEISTHQMVLNGRDVLLSVARDITDRKEAEATIRDGEERLKENMLTSLREKETLLKEIHHRVKNNMQIIISLLKLQEFKTTDPAVQELLRDCSSRIYSMVIVHEKIYQSTGLSGVYLDEYARELCTRIISDYEEKTGAIRFDLVAHDRVMVDIATGIPIGLILNELITNSIKYAFPAHHNGEIRIEIKKDRNCTITVSDNGVGLPEGFDERTHSSLGVVLVTKLAYQLGGEAVWTSDNGTVCTVTFPLEKEHMEKKVA